MEVVIVGGGLAGLTCGRVLHQAGHTVSLLEASDDIGGRVRSDYADGYMFDRGFQVLFDAYPAAQQQLDLVALALHAFDAGAIICWQGQRAVLTDPLRESSPFATVQAALSPVLPLADKLRTLRLALELRRRASTAMPDEDDSSTLDYLHQRGFSSQAIERFYRPFFGGIFLDRALSTSSRNFRFYYQMLSVGSACLPADGMQAIGKQLAAPLRAADCIRCNARVAELLHGEGRVRGVRREDGSSLSADAVVLATPAPEVARLSGLRMPTGAMQTVNLYFASSQPLYQGRKLLLNAAPDAFVNNAQLLTNVVPAYAPPGQHLLSATVVGSLEQTASLDDAALFARAQADLRAMFAGDSRALAALETYQPLRLYRIDYAQFPQPPGHARSLPGNRTERAGLYLAGEFTHSSSIHGALHSGAACAQTLLEGAG